jgi:hypothetical protein
MTRRSGGKRAADPLRDDLRGLYRGIAEMRGFAVLARCAGLVGHIAEGQTRPAMRAIWEGAERAVPYVPG